MSEQCIGKHLQFCLVFQFLLQRKEKIRNTIKKTNAQWRLQNSHSKLCTFPFWILMQNHLFFKAASLYRKMICQSCQHLLMSFCQTTYFLNLWRLKHKPVLCIHSKDVLIVFTMAQIRSVSIRQNKVNHKNVFLFQLLGYFFKSRNMKIFQGDF